MHTVTWCSQGKQNFGVRAYLLDKKRRTLNNYVRQRLYFIDMGRFIDYKANNL
jgi:hypothetical protein